MIQRNFLLLYLFCGLVVAACTPTARPSQSAHVATAATAAKPQLHLNRSPRTRRKSGLQERNDYRDTLPATLLCDAG